MVFAVAGTMPGLIVHAYSHNIHRSGSYPGTIVHFEYDIAHFRVGFGIKYYIAHGLTVYC